MARVSVFNSPFLLGFDHIERLLEDISRAGAGGYPPYNIERRGADCLRITVAVAGFGPAELSVTIEQDQLDISGRQVEDNKRIFVHRGIAARQFRRSFVLADGMEVKEASLANGLLNIDLIRVQPEARVRNIEINAADENVTSEIPVEAAQQDVKSKGAKDV